MTTLTETRSTTLAGKVAVITGASKGIGAGIARSFGAAGASVVVNYGSNKGDALRVVEHIVGNGGKAVAVQADMSRASDIARLFDETERAFGGLDVLVNNAGVYEFAPLEAITEAVFHRHFDINVLGPILAIQAALKHFGPKGGSVINISSVASVSRLPNAVVYAATKAALDSVTRTLAAELASRGIRVNTIAPGSTETEGFRDMSAILPGLEKMLVDATPMGRVGRPEDISPLALFLASDASGWMTGDRISASGGAY